MIDKQRLVQQLYQHEGLRLKPYRDSAGKLTIGVGRNLDDVGISQQEAEYLLSNDIDRALRDAQTLPFFEKLDIVRRNALVELIFNMGIPTLRGFRRMLASLDEGNYPKAAAELIDSRWTHQVGPTRSGRLMSMLRDGRWPTE